MSGISAPRRAWIATVRRPARSLVLLAIMTLVFTALVAQSGVRTTMSQLRSAIDASVGAGFTATAPSGQLPEDDAQRLAALPGLRKHAFEADALARPDKATPVQAAGAVQLDPEFAGDVGLTGTTDSSLYPAFQGRLFTLAEGRHLDGGQPGALIHRAFAEQNHLRMGSPLTLTLDGRTVTVPVAGIFDGKAENPTGLPSGASENKVFLTLAELRKLTGDEALTVARFEAKAASGLSDVLNQARQGAPGLTIEDNRAQFQSVLTSIEAVEKVLGLLLLVACGVSVVVLGLVLVFWVRGRIREIGVLLAIGNPKSTIAGQFCLEVALLAAASSVLALVLGQLLGGALASRVLASSGDPALSALSPASGSVLSVLAALGVGMLVVTAALAVALAPVLRRSPKSILSSMN